MVFKIYRKIWKRWRSYKFKKI